jgi:hypothetical protein
MQDCGEVLKEKKRKEKKRKKKGKKYYEKYYENTLHIIETARYLRADLNRKNTLAIYFDVIL